MWEAACRSLYDPLCISMFLVASFPGFIMGVVYGAYGLLCITYEYIRKRNDFYFYPEHIYLLCMAIFWICVLFYDIYLLKHNYCGRSF